MEPKEWIAGTAASVVSYALGRLDSTGDQAAAALDEDNKHVPRRHEDG